MSRVKKQVVSLTLSLLLNIPLYATVPSALPNHYTNSTLPISSNNYTNSTFPNLTCPAWQKDLFENDNFTCPATHDDVKIEPIMFAMFENKPDFVTDEQWAFISNSRMSRGQHRTQEEMQYLFGPGPYDDLYIPTTYKKITDFVKTNLVPVVVLIGACVFTYYLWALCLFPFYLSHVKTDMRRAINDEMQEHLEVERKTRPYVHKGLRVGETMNIPAIATEDQEAQVVDYDPRNKFHVRLVSLSLQIAQRLADERNEAVLNIVTRDLHYPGDTYITPEPVDQLPPVFEYWERAYSQSQALKNYVEHVKERNKLSDKPYPLPGWLIFLENEDGQMRLEYFNPTDENHVRQIDASLNRCYDFMRHHPYRINKKVRTITNPVLRQVYSSDMQQQIVSFDYNAPIAMLHDAPKFTDPQFKPSLKDLIENGVFQYDFKAKERRLSSLTRSQKVDVTPDFLKKYKFPPPPPSHIIT
ncbi:MAG: hypothetical protein LBM22_00405 [Endomicrobium sp.]|jgi:hypothetical protein|nr:hypothetical protein [Endomicrobium sp.]